MAEEKDRFGDKLRQKEKAEEDRYFAELDRKRLEKLRQEQEGEQEQTIRDIARGRCPKCGVRLEATTIARVEIDECPQCNGMWLDKGELEALSQGERETWLSHLMGVLVKPVR